MMDSSVSGISFLESGTRDTLTYSLGETRIAVGGLAAYDAERLRSLWQRCFALQETGVGNAHLCLHFGPGLYCPDVSRRGREVFDSPRVRVWETPSGFYLQCGASMLDLDLAQGVGRGILDEGFWKRPLQDQREFFLLSLVMLLHQRGLYGLHANGVVNEETGYLIVGRSGSGKTTLTASLMRQGWRVLADDALLLRDTPGGVQALALRRGFSFTDETLSYFPGLGPDKAEEDSSLVTDNGKHLMDLTPLYPRSFAARSEPGVLLFPRVEGHARSELRPMNKTHAFIGLAQQAAGILTDRALAGDQLNVLSRLVHQARSYQLLLGTDVYENPAAVAELLRNAERG
jgi:hypothetical protein